MLKQLLLLKIKHTKLSFSKRFVSHSTDIVVISWYVEYFSYIKQYMPDLSVRHTHLETQTMHAYNAHLSSKQNSENYREKCLRYVGQKNQ